MAVTQTLSEGLKREFEVIITKKEIEKLVDQKLESIAKEAKLPGFRPGKVPVSVVKNRFGLAILVFHKNWKNEGVVLVCSLCGKVTGLIPT